MLDDIVKERKNKKVFSQAGNNKVSGIVKSLRLNECLVTILSQAITNNKTGKFYNGFKSNLGKDLYYVPILDIPILNSISSIISTFLKVSKLNKIKKIDYVLFYNYKPETAITALFCKIFLNINIIVDYEDGYFSLKSISSVKRTIFNLTEKIVSRFISSAILVNSKLTERVGNKKCFVVRGIINDKILARVNSKIKKKNEKPVIMYSGGLDEERGVKVLLDSLKYIKEDFKLIISGSGPLSDYVEKYPDKRIEYVGFIENYNLVIDMLINSDILVNPQLSNIDFGIASFPSKVYEYLSTGNAIVSSDVADIEEYFEGCIYIYRDNSPELLAKQVQAALKHKDFKRIRDIIKHIQIKNTYKKIGLDLIDTIF